MFTNRSTIFTKDVNLACLSSVFNYLYSAKSGSIIDAIDYINIIICLQSIGYYVKGCFCRTFTFNNLCIYIFIWIFCVIFDSFPESIYIDDAGFCCLKMYCQDVCSIRMIFCNPLSGKISELLIIRSNDSIYKIVVIFCNYVINVNYFYACIFACLKNCLCSS